MHFIPFPVSLFEIWANNDKEKVLLKWLCYAEMPDAYAPISDQDS